MGDIVRHEGMARPSTTHIRSLCYGSEDWQARHCFVLALLACTDLVYQSINAQARVALRLELLSEPMYPQGPKSSRLVWWWICRALLTITCVVRVGKPVSHTTTLLISDFSLCRRCLAREELPMHMTRLCMWPAMHHDSTSHMQSQCHPFGRAHCIWRTAQLEGEVLTQNR